MKKFLLASLALLSLNAFAQSYIIMDNGIAITIDRDGFAYDFGNYAFPQKITLKGGTFFVEENNVLATIDEKGALFRKYEVIPENVLGKGVNFFLSAEGELTTIDHKGVAHMSQNDMYKKATNFGGSYFVVTKDAERKEMDLYTVTGDGEVIKADTGALKMKDVVSYGGNYFMTNRGVLYTVSAAGVVMPQTMRVGVIQKRGGNFFVDSASMFYTVSESGELILPALPINMKLSTVSKYGSNYFLDLSGRLFVVDKTGNVFERIMRDYDFRNARIISL